MATEKANSTLQKAFIYMVNNKHVQLATQKIKKLPKHTIEAIDYELKTGNLWLISSIQADGTLILISEQSSILDCINPRDLKFN